MKWLIWLITLSLSAQPVYSWDLSELFKPQKKKVVQQTGHSKKTKKKAEPSPTPKPKADEGRKNYYQVDADWMARYSALEAIWKYQIPEDDQIIFEAGKYYVPPVVYRHYDDMAVTPKRNGSRAAPH